MDTVDLIGVRADGTQEKIGEAAMPPRMRAREIVASYFGHPMADGDGDSDADLCLAAMDDLLAWLRDNRLLLSAAIAAGHAEPVAVPARYALVPVEPTDEMVIRGGEAVFDAIGTHGDDGDSDIDQGHAESIYRAMIAAAPPAPAAEQAPEPSCPHITQPFTLEEIRAQIVSHDYSAELLLQHAMVLLDAAENAEPGLADQWRSLALRFDRHRMAAMSHLRTLLDNPEAHAAAARAFLDEPPPPAGTCQTCTAPSSDGFKDVADLARFYPSDTECMPVAAGTVRRLLGEACWQPARSQIAGALVACPHVITDAKVILEVDPTEPGNALAQAVNRLTAAFAAGRAAT